MKYCESCQDMENCETYGGCWNPPAKDNPLSPSDATACCALPYGAAIPWIEGIRGMVRDRQHEITLMMDAAPAKNFPLENAAWQRVRHELDAVADLCNRMVTRASRPNPPNESSDGAAGSGPNSP